MKQGWTLEVGDRSEDVKQEVAESRKAMVLAGQDCVGCVSSGNNTSTTTPTTAKTTTNTTTRGIISKRSSGTSSSSSSSSRPAVKIKEQIVGVVLDQQY